MPGQLGVDRLVALSAVLVAPRLTGLEVDPDEEVGVSDEVADEQHCLVDDGRSRVHRSTGRCCRVEQRGVAVARDVDGDDVDPLGDSFQRVALVAQAELGCQGEGRLLTRGRALDETVRGGVLESQPVPALQDGEDVPGRVEPAITEAFHSSP